FPRTVQQAKALGEMLTTLDRRLAGVLHMKVSDEEIVRRLSGRLTCIDCQAPYHPEFNPPMTPGLCDGCGGELYQRDDDNPETVRAQLATFHRQTEPLIAYYTDAALLVEIRAEGTVDEVAVRAIAAAEAIQERIAGN